LRITLTQGAAPLALPDLRLGGHWCVIAAITKASITQYTLCCFRICHGVVFQDVLTTCCKSQSKMLRERKSGKWSFENFFLGSELVLLHSTLERWRPSAFPLCLVQSSGWTQRDFRRLKISLRQISLN